MTGHVASSYLEAEFASFVAERIGLHLPEGRRHELRRCVDALARELKFPDPSTCMRELMTSQLTQAQIDSLASNLTVGETYFFREPHTFEALESEVFPRLAAEHDKDRNLRIWSAGCCTGEEPYSIAISLLRALPDPSSWNVPILATDINPHFLRRAGEGVFAEWSFRNAPEWLRPQFFEKVGSRHWEISSRVKEMVTFAPLNLAEDSYPSLLNGTNGLDLIFCRNVLIYFEQERAREVISNLGRCLGNRGWLVVSPSELPQVRGDRLKPVELGKATLFQSSPDRGEPSSAPIAVVADEDDASVLSLPEEADASPKPSERPTTVLPRATRCFDRGDYATAARLLAAHLKTYPRDTASVLLYARTLANKGDLEAALVWCKTYAEIEKLDPYAHYLTGMVHFEVGNGEEAVKSIERAVFLDPEFVTAHMAMGHVLKSLGDCRSSRRSYANAHRIASALEQGACIRESDGITAGRLVAMLETILEDSTEEEAK